jgi:hypothetical protein
VYNPQLEALITEGWTELLFPISAFNNVDVNLSDITELSIGIGFHLDSITHNVSIGLFQTDPSCGYCSYNGTVYVDDVKLKELGESYEALWKQAYFNRCLLTGCVFDGNDAVSNAKVTLVPTSGSGGMSTFTCNVGRYLMNPVIVDYIVTVVNTNTKAIIYEEPLSDTIVLQPGLNETNFPPKIIGHQIRRNTNMVME